MTDRRCWTCDKVVANAAAQACTRPYCAARRDVEKDLANGSLVPSAAYADYAWGSSPILHDGWKGEGI